MKKRLLLTILLVLMIVVLVQGGLSEKVSYSPFSQTNNLASPTNLVEEWTYAVQSPDGVKDEIDGVSTDSEGNIFIGGLFSDTVDFGGTKRTAGAGSDIFVGKLDPEGNELWFQTFDSGADDFMWDLTTDQNNDVILSGGYGGTMVVNGRSYNAARDGSAYYAKINGKTGKIIWFQTAGVIGETGVVNAERTAGGNEVKVDSKGNILAILSGGGDEYQIGNERFSKSGFMDSFIVKLSPQGEFMWTHHFLGDGRKQARAIAVTGEDTVVFGHQLTGPIEDESGRLLNTAGDTNVAQGVFGMLSADGELLWMHPVYSDGFANVRGAGGDSDSGDAYFTGVITGDSDIAGTKVKGLANGSTFLAKFDKRGEMLWLRVMGNKEQDSAGELIASDNLVALTSSNNGSDYSVYDENGTLLYEDLFSVDGKQSRATLTLFNEDGALVSQYEPKYTDNSAAGVLEFTTNGCIILQTSFAGNIEYNNGDKYETLQKDKDAVLVKLCPSVMPSPSSQNNPLPQAVSDNTGFVLEEVGEHGLTYYSLDGAKGVMLCFHGTGGSAKGWANPGDDNQAFVVNMAEAGWSYVCPTSLDRTKKQWSPVNNLSNPDVQNVDALLDSLGITQNTPLILVGHSNGGGMASRYAIGSKRAGDIVAVQFSNSGGLTQVLKLKEYTFPTLFNYSLCDQTVKSADVEESYSILQKRGIATTLNALDDTYAAGSYKSCHAFVNTGTKVLELLP